MKIHPNINILPQIGSYYMRNFKTHLNQYLNISNATGYYTHEDEEFYYFGTTKYNEINNIITFVVYKLNWESLVKEKLVKRIK